MYVGVVDRLKLSWHRDLASHPVTHAWVLNLYRAGEQHPETVDDYFPYQHAPWPELAANIKRHAGDERRHTVLYAKAIERMGGAVVELGGWDVFNRVIREHTPRGFAIADDDAPDVKREQLGHFLAHAHCLERRVLRSVEYHAEACAQLGRREEASLVEKVHADEARHVSYSKEAVFELLGRREALAAFELHGRAEAAADRAFSAFQVRVFMDQHARHVPLSRRLVYTACAALMQGMA
ncbi:MAG: hypothetical protein H6719_09750 [Sandaracinaceae bacterium]|nr:hypothetical protein [Sandaracinaceae bacterium]